MVEDVTSCWDCVQSWRNTEGIGIDLARDKDVSVGEGAYGVSELLKIKKKKKNANKQTQHLQVTALRLRKCNTTML